MSEAAIGLVGVVVGALLAGLFEYGVRRRTESLDARAAARLLRDAFFLVLESLPVYPGAEPPDVYDFKAATDDWRDHRGVLARSLTNAEWNTVVEAFQLLTAISGSPSGQVGRPTAHTRQSGVTAEEFEKGIVRLLSDTLLDATVALERVASGRRHARRVKRELRQPL